MFECTRKPGYAFAGETHDFWECVYVQKGQICVTADDRVYSMKSGEMIFHKPMELHKYYVEGNNEAKLFIFSYSASGEINSFFKNKVFELNSEQIQILDNLIAYTAAIYPYHTNEEFGKMLESIRNSPVKLSAISNHIECLMLNIYESYDISRESETGSAKIYKQAVNYMKDNIDKNLKISDIAEYCCISSTGLKNLFVRYSGLGVHCYFLKLKINQATKMLKSGISVSETSEKLGFSGQPYFSAAYKRETGRSPSQIYNNIKPD
jgi:AraC-like DNA-binding protein